MQDLAVAEQRKAFNWVMASLSKRAATPTSSKVVTLAKKRRAAVKEDLPNKVRINTNWL